VPEYRRALGRAHYQFGRILIERGKPELAMNEAQKSAALHRQNLDANHDSDPDSRSLADDQNLLALAFISAGRLGDAAAAAEELIAIRPSDPGVYHFTAAFLVRCAEKALHTADGLPFAIDCLNRAVRILGAGVRAKVIRFRYWLDKDDLGALRKR